jgi:hypothetical protein
LREKVCSRVFVRRNRMVGMMRNLLGLAGAVPVIVLVAAVYVEKLRRKAAGVRLPTEEKLLRPAGYSLGKRVEDLTEDYVTLLFAAFMCALFAAGAFGCASDRLSDRLPGFIVFGGASAFFTILAWRKLRVVRRCRLGLLGEQTMGDLLGRLAREGYRIFHDVPGSGNWNVDHVAVGRGGIFAIETKCRMKRPVRGKAEQDVMVDADVIRFPGYSDLRTVAQARRNAEWVAKEFSEAVGEDLRVKPVVALPGWFVVKPSKEWSVWVLSGKMVPSWIEGEPQGISEELVRRVSYQLDRRCRDVEM